RGPHPAAQGDVHDRHRHAQHAAGGAGLGPDGLLQPGRRRQAGSARRDGRHREDLLQPVRPAHRGLHLRPLRVTVLASRGALRPEGAKTALAYGARMAQHYDVVVIGSGFGGSVAALRLTEKGYRVGVLEAGRRFADDEFPANSWHLKDYLYAPALGWYGLARFTLLRNALLVNGAGVGGGSLVYANT